MEDRQLRILTGWLNQSDRLSDLAFEVYDRGLIKLDRDRRAIGFHPREYEEFEDWIRTSDGRVSFEGFSMQLEAAAGFRTSDYRYFAAARRTPKRYEGETSQFLRARLKAGMTFVDIGANAGYFSLMAASLVGPRGRVESFEPDPDSYLRLVRNARLNGFDQVEAHPVALTNRRGKAYLYASPGESGGNSLIPVAGHGALRPVDVDTLDHVLEGTPIDGMKIDVEGLEEDVLAGARGTLMRNPHAFVIFEYNKLALFEGRRSYEGMFTALRTLGWEVHALRPDGRIGREVRTHYDAGSIIANLVANRPAFTA